MKPNVPWSVKGIEPDARVAAKAAARRAGMTLGEWLNSVIYDAGGEAAEGASHVNGGADAALRDSVEKLARRFEAAEHRSGAAVESIDQTLAQALARIDVIEKAGPATAESIAPEALVAVAQRLDALETAARATGEETGGARGAIEPMLNALAAKIDQERDETRDRIAASDVAVADAARRIEELRSDLAETVTRIDDRLSRQTERLDAAGDPDAAARAAKRIRALGDEIHRNADQMKRIEATLGRLEAAIDAAEGRSAEGVARVSDAVAALENRYEADRTRPVPAPPIVEPSPGPSRGAEPDQFADLERALTTRIEGALAAMERRLDARIDTAAERKADAPVDMTVESADAAAQEFASGADEALSPEAASDDDAAVEDGRARPPSIFNFDDALEDDDDDGEDPLRDEERESPVSGARLDDVQQEDELAQQDDASVLKRARQAARSEAETRARRARERGLKLRRSAERGKPLNDRHNDEDEAPLSARRPRSPDAEPERREDSAPKEGLQGRLVAVGLILALGAAALGGWLMLAEPSVGAPEVFARIDDTAPAPDAAATSIAAPTSAEAVAAAKRAEAEALYERAMSQLSVSGDPASFEAALADLRTAADNGSALAQLQLGEFYKGDLAPAGGGADTNFAEARLWYERAAIGGNRLAMHRLGVLHARGLGGPVDYEAAARWLTSAANLGLVDSQYNLGVLHHPASSGEATPIQSLSEAFYWYTLAGRNGDAQAGDLAASLGARLPPAERTALEARAASWRPGALDLSANEHAAKG